MEGLSPDLVAALVTIASLGGTGVLAYLAIRRARAARLRHIESAGEARPPLKPPERRPLRPEDVDGEAAADGTAAQRPEQTRGEAAEGQPGAISALTAEPEPSTAAPPVTAKERSAQILPFPAPTPPIVLPVEKPRAEPAPKARKRDVTALVPGLARTRSGWVARLGQVFSGKKEIDPALVGEIEKIMLTADIGVRTSQKLLDEIRASLGKKELADPDAVWRFLRRRTAEILTVSAPAMSFDGSRPFVLLVVGVNGSGKTTTIGKLAAKLKADGKSVLLAAGDTFRAAAVEQLEVWGARTGTPVVRGREGADPSSVVFEGVKRAAHEKVDVVIADTAGRLHTKTNLMEELQKIRRVLGKAADGAPHQTWLVIDATSGQNAIAQAQIFTQTMQVTGIVLTKLDGTAKGGVILGITDQLGIPIRYVGVGERVEDLHEFDPEEFVEALLGDSLSATPAAS